MLYGTLIVVALYYLLPLYVMVVTSLKGMPEIRSAISFAAAGDHLRALGQGLGHRLHRPQLRRPVARLLELGAHHRPVGDRLDRVASVNGYALANWRSRARTSSSRS
jgi:glucose/mannose transport system permease protein